MSCQHIPELFSVKYLRRESVSLAVSPSSLPPHEVPHLLHPGGRNVYRLKLNAPCLQNRAYRLLLAGYLWTKISLKCCCRNHKERHFTFALPELPLMNTLMAMFSRDNFLYLYCICLVYSSLPPQRLSRKVLQMLTLTGPGHSERIRKADSGFRLGDDTMPGPEHIMMTRDISGETLRIQVIER